MEPTPPTRDDIANQVHSSIITLQDALTHLWAAVLAVEVIDVAPMTEAKRREVQEALKTAYLNWKEAQAALDAAFPEWSAVVGAQYNQVASVREWLRDVLPE